MLAHVLQHQVGGVATVLTGRLGCHGQWVDECLRMVFANVYQQMVDQTANQLPMSVDASNQLRNDLKVHTDEQRKAKQGGVGREEETSNTQLQTFHRSASCRHAHSALLLEDPNPVS